MSTGDTIYLIDDTGCAQTNDPRYAKALIEVVGFHECTREEYESMRRRLSQLDGTMDFDEGEETE